MSDHQARMFRDAEAYGNLIDDPGNAGVIDPNRFADGVCVMTAAGTRVLALADAFPVGIRITLIAKASITITQEDSRAFNADAETDVSMEVGSAAMFVLGFESGGDKAWLHVGGALVAEA